MSTPEHYNTIEQAGQAEFKDRGSRFIAFAFSVPAVTEFKKQLQFLKKEHAKAVHHCFAYRMGTDGNNFRSSDDGEPAGTAGKPILGQIDSKELTDVGIVIVRYFGGSLLGVPGLINAYRTASSLVLQVVPVIQKSIVQLYNINFDYTRINDVMVIIKQYQCTILSQEMMLFCKMKVGIPIGRNAEVLYKLKDLLHVDVQVAAAK